ncbi:SCO family protein [Antarcticimicrobium sp.]|uniref:SCO family protein n=1 Tax=Antarcticimicrobium sp. TaxID=2824147 RepID=UPI002607A458|nr:SCO family protein [Antarcticimicrobium sp.]
MGVLRRLSFLFCAAVLTSTAQGQTLNRPADALDAKQVYEVSQAAIGREVSAHVLRDQTGAPLALADLRGRPLVISLVYTSCSSICPVTTERLRDAVADAGQILGEGSFAVLTFGFDSSGDKPARLRAFSILHDLNTLDDWYLASADPETTEALLLDLGFNWREAAGSFDHPSQTTILDSEGRVYRQIYGEDFPLPVFVTPLKELVLGRTTVSVAPTDLWNRLTFLCTVYNPLTRAYRFDYGILFGIFFGAVSLLLTGLIIIRLWIERRRATRKDVVLRPEGQWLK